MNHSKAVFLLLAVGCSGTAAIPSLAAQSFSLEQILSAPFPSELTATAQGSEIAWVFVQKGAQNIWMAQGPKYAPRQVTHYTGDSGQPIASLRLSLDGKSVVYARGTEINAGGQSANPTSDAVQPKQQVWMAAVDGGEPRLLGDMGCEGEGCEDIELSPDGRWAVWETRHELWIASTEAGGSQAKQLTDIRGSISSPQWSPDGTRIVATVNRGDHALTAILDVRGSALQQIHYIAPSTDRDLAPQWSPDGSRVAFLRIGGVEQGRPSIPVYPVPFSVWVADAHSYAASAIWKSGTTSRDSLPPFGPGEFLFAATDRVVFSSEQDNWNHLYSIPASGGTATLLTPGDYDVENASLSTDKHYLFVTSNENDIDRRHIWRVPVAGGEPPKALAHGDTIEWMPVETDNGKAIFCLGSTAITPGLVYRLSAGERELITPDALPNEFPSVDLVVPRQVLFKSADGLTLHGQLFVPKHQSKPGAGIIFTHGGPPRQMLLGFHYMDFYSYSYAENEYLANLGFTVLSVNYRLSEMYGHDFREAPNTIWRGASEYQDVLAGAHYLQSLPNVDPNRIGLWGGSYGGFLTAMGLARNSDIFKAGVDYAGVHDWTSNMSDFSEGENSAPDLKQATALAFSSSPNASISKWKSPVLLIQGDDDRNVPFSETVSLAQKLRRQGVPFEEIVYPDEIHDMLLWRNIVNDFQATSDFLVRYLEPKQ